MKTNKRKTKFIKYLLRSIPAIALIAVLFCTTSVHAASVSPSWPHPSGNWNDNSVNKSTYYVLNKTLADFKNNGTYVVGTSASKGAAYYATSITPDLKAGNFIYAVHTGLAANGTRTLKEMFNYAPNPAQNRCRALYTKVFQVPKNSAGLYITFGSVNTNVLISIFCTNSSGVVTEFAPAFLESSAGYKINSNNTEYVLVYFKHNDGLTTAGTGVNHDMSVEMNDSYILKTDLYVVFHPYNIKLDNQSATTAGSTYLYERFGAGYYATAGEGTAITSITVPTRTGYTFGGYYTGTNGSGIQIIDASGNILTHNKYFSPDGKNNTLKVASGDINYTLYAKWIGNIYTNTLSYNANGGSGAPASQTGTVTYPNTAKSFAISSTVPTRAGYTFLGWSTSSTATSATYATGSAIAVGSNSVTGNQSVTLYAVWKANGYVNQLHYNANGGSGAPASQTVNVTYPNTAYTHTVSGTVPTLAGHTFAGWYTAASGGSKVGTTHTIGSNSYAGNQGATIYAHWTANSYTNYLYYNANGGSNAPGTQSATVTYPNTAKTFTVSSTIPTRTGYTFLGWSTSSTAASASYGAGGSITVGTNNNAGNQSVTLYAVWKANSYTNTLVYNANGGSGAPASQSVTVTYPNTSYTHTVSGVIPTRAGYTFLGWGTTASATTNVGATVTVGSNSYTGNQSITLYARWALNSYSITYNLNGGTATNPGSYNVNTETFTLNNPVKSGYTFLGWTGSNGSTPQTTVTIAKGSTGNRTYTANWKILDTKAPDITLPFGMWEKETQKILTFTAKDDSVGIKSFTITNPSGTVIASAFQPEGNNSLLTISCSKVTASGTYTVTATDYLNNTNTTVLKVAEIEVVDADIFNYESISDALEIRHYLGTVGYDTKNAEISNNTEACDIYGNPYEYYFIDCEGNGLWRPYYHVATTKITVSESGNTIYRFFDAGIDIDVKIAGEIKKNTMSSFTINCSGYCDKLYVCMPDVYTNISWEDVSFPRGITFNGEINNILSESEKLTTDLINITKNYTQSTEYKFLTPASVGTFSFKIIAERVPSAIWTAAVSGKNFVNVVDYTELVTTTATTEVFDSVFKTTLGKVLYQIVTYKIKHLYEIN